MHSSTAAPEVWMEPGTLLVDAEQHWHDFITQNCRI